MTPSAELAPCVAVAEPDREPQPPGGLFSRRVATAKTGLVSKEDIGTFLKTIIVLIRERIENRRFPPHPTHPPSPRSFHAFHFPTQFHKYSPWKLVYVCAVKCLFVTKEHHQSTFFPSCHSHHIMRPTLFSKKREEPSVPNTWQCQKQHQNTFAIQAKRKTIPNTFSPRNKGTNRRRWGISSAFELPST